MELYINEDKELFDELLQNKETIESDAGLVFDWRKLPEKKASRIIVVKSGIAFDNQAQWEEQFRWITSTMIKMKLALKKYIL